MNGMMHTIYSKTVNISLHIVITKKLTMFLVSMAIALSKQLPDRELPHWYLNARVASRSLRLFHTLISCVLVNKHDIIL
jgi:hypothetical protein